MLWLFVLSGLVNLSEEKIAVDQRLVCAAERLAKLVLIFPHKHLGALIDLTIGGLASLIRSEQLEYEDRKEPLPPAYYQKLSERVRKMTAGTLPPRGRWLSGYYFNSALLRIGAAREATRKLLSALDKSKHGRQSGITLGPSNVDDVYQEVNRLKHDLRGLSKDRWVTFEQAMQALDELVSVLDGRKNELSNPNTKFPVMAYKPRRRKKHK